jgi:hypothetical protein
MLVNMHLFMDVGENKTSTNIFAVSITRKGSSFTVTRNKFSFALNASLIISTKPV